MPVIDFILLAITLLVILPVLAYLVMKFGAVGYLRGRAQQKEDRKETYEQKQK